MAYFLSMLVSGLKLGSIYAIVAIGYSIVYGILRLINFAHGDIMTVGVYIILVLMNRMGVPTPLCSFVQLSVNGEPWGLYLAVEGVEEGFLERNGMSKGELYKPDSLSFGGGRGNGKEFDFPQFSTSSDASNDSDTSGNAPQSAPTMPGSSSQPSAPDSSADEFAPSSGAPANFPSGSDFAPSSGDRAQTPPSMPNFSFGGSTSDSTDADTDGTTTRRTFSRYSKIIFKVWACAPAAIRMERRGCHTNFILAHGEMLPVHRTTKATCKTIQCLYYLKLFHTKFCKTILLRCIGKGRLFCHNQAARVLF